MISPMQSRDTTMWATSTKTLPQKEGSERDDQHDEHFHLIPFKRSQGYRPSKRISLV